MQKGCRALLILVFTVLLLMLCGCGSKVNTQLQIEEGFQGARVMNCVISKSELNNRVVGGVDSVDAMLALNCPSELSYEKTEEGADVVYRFTLSFASEEEYEKKVTALLSRTPSILYAMPDSVFAQGFRLEEDFTSLDLMAWFDKTAVEKGLLQEGESLLSSGETTLALNGSDVAVQEKISYNDIEYKPIDKISLNTKVQKDESFQRTIAFQIPRSTYEADEKGVQAYMDTLVPEGGEGVWKDIPTGRTFTLTFDAATVEELGEKTKTALDSEDISVVLDDSESTLFSNQMNFTETLNFASFASGRGGRVFVDYQYQTDSNSGIASARIYQKGDWIGADEYVEKNRFSIANDMASLKVNLQSENEYTVEKVSIEMEQTSQGSFRRCIRLRFQNNENNSAAQAAKKYFDKLPIQNVKTEVRGNTCSLTMTGGIEEINLALKDLFGEENELQLIFEGGFQLHHNTRLEDRMDLSAFLEEIGYQGQIDYSYTSQLDITESIQRSLVDGQTLSGTIDGKQTQGTLISGAKSEMVMTASVLYVPFVWAIVGLSLVVIVVIMGIVLLLMRVSAVRRRGTYDYKRAHPSGQVCAHCKRPLYDGMLYCIYCGEPLYDLENTELVVLQDDLFEEDIGALLAAADVDGEYVQGKSPEK